MRSENLADYIELWGFEDDYAVFIDGSLGFGLEVTPLSVASFTDDSTNESSEHLKNLLNSLPKDLDIQFVQDIRSSGGTTIDQFESLSRSVKNPTAKKLAAEKVIKYRNMQKKGELPHHSLKVFVRKAFTHKKLKTSFLSGTTSSERISKETLESEIKASERIKFDLMAQFEAADMNASTLSSSEIAELIYVQWNPSHPLGMGKVNLGDIRDDLLFTDVSILENGFQMGRWQYRVISLKNLPDNTYTSMARKLRSLAFDSRLFLSVRVPDQEKAVESLKSQRRVAFSMVAGQGSGVVDIESESKYQDIETLLQEMIAQGEKAFFASMTILLRSEDPNALETQVADTLSILRDLGGSEGLLETAPSFDVFQEVAIPHARGREREKCMKSSNLKDLLPVYAPWRGHENPRLLFRSSVGSLLTIDPFDSSHKNANQLISAGSGAGKSFFCNLALLQMLKEDPRIFLVDIGGSYQKLCENLGGQYIPLGVDGDIAINPFDLPKGDFEPSKKKIKFLVGLVEIMTKEDEASGLPKLTRSLLEESIIRVYENIQRPKMSDLRKILLRSDNLKLQDIGKILGSWCGNTAYGQFIDRETNIDLSEDLISFDLKGLESSSDLQTVCLYIITDLIWSNIQLDRYRMKFVVFDECWKLLKDKAGQDFIESFFRTCRKYYTSSIAISQAIVDFAESPIASAIMPNCEIKWLFQQGQSDSRALRSHLGLNDNELQLVSGLRQKQGQFSEGYLMSGPKNRSVVAVEPTPLELWIATTNPKDLKLVESRKRSRPNTPQIKILEELAHEYPNGA